MVSMVAYTALATIAPNRASSELRAGSQYTATPSMAACVEPAADNQSPHSRGMRLGLRRGPDADPCADAPVAHSGHKVLSSTPKFTKGSR